MLLPDDEDELLDKDGHAVPRGVDAADTLLEPASEPSSSLPPLTLRLDANSITRSLS